MWFPKNEEKKETIHRLVAVAISRNKGSYRALKWATEHLLNRGQTVVLVHVNVSPTLDTPTYHVCFVGAESSHISDANDELNRELFLPFRCLCTRRDIKCQDVVLEDTDVVKALVAYVVQSATEILVLGAHSKNALLKKWKTTDIPLSVTKATPDFCTVYVVSKGKISSRSALRPAPLRNHALNQRSIRSNHSETPKHSRICTTEAPRLLPPSSHYMQHEMDWIIKSPFTHRRGPTGKSYPDLSTPESDTSFASSGTPSVDQMTNPHSFSDNTHSFESQQLGHKSVDTTSTPPPEYSSSSQDSDNSYSSQTMDDAEAEMRKLKLELKKTMDMYCTACKEAFEAKEKANELQRWKMEEQQELERVRLSEEAALEIVGKEREKSRAALEAAEAAQRIAELEARKRIDAERRALKEAEEKNKVLHKLAELEVRYRKYTIEEIEAATNYFSLSRKIGEGGYGPVFKCYLDHTEVAVKVLRPDAAQGRSQFQQEVEVLSTVRHPNMVLLLGACPEYGCLVYEYMSNGSLEDRLFRHGNTPPLSWQQRFRIAAEIGTALLFLHQTKPEPLVHRDLKPANILLDRNYVSKISDVGLARLVPPSVAENVTQYRMTSAAGTFCYIDPEYQQTGMLGVKSDIYSLGIMFLQIITAKPPMGLTHHVGLAIEKGTFTKMLDPEVPDWPVEEALSFANIALKCSELRRKDRPDLNKVIMPELERLRAFAEESMVFDCVSVSDNQSQFSMSQDEFSCSTPVQSGQGSSKSNLTSSG
ncbi:U-box domain-containing protein 35-like [Diospyros lotus]|uniref:U-box domain-containing protein 35-like n=1 Tax=Diospyros lotus TaxID=55363 RepID=UPI002259E362|nr:U-box domain-containing protein 35-like [Diospyros lotus]